MDAVTFVGGMALGCLFAFLLCGLCALRRAGRGGQERMDTLSLRRRQEIYKLRVAQASQENLELKRRLQELELEVEPLRRPGEHYSGTALDTVFKVKSVK